MSPAPTKLHRVNGFTALEAVYAAARTADDGTAVSGAPRDVVMRLLNELAKNGFYIGVEDHDA